MHQTHLIATIFVLLFPNFLIGQINCKKENLIGSWDYISSPAFNRTNNVDSLAPNLTNSEKIIGTWSFYDNGKYVYKANTFLKRKSTGQYKFIQENCEIRLGDKNETPIGLIFHIFLLDDKYLITKCTKPKGDFIYFHRRK